MTTQVLGAKYVLGMVNGEQTLLEDHYVYIDGSSIEAVCRDAPAATEPFVQYEHGFILPGFVNVHSHCLNGALFRGIPDDLPLDPWITELIYKVLMPLGDIAGQVLSRDDLEAVTALGMIDVLKGGSTTLMDMWFHGQEVFFDVARKVGIRAIGAPYIMSTTKLGLGSDNRPFYEFGNGTATLDRSIELFKRFDEGPTGRIQVALGPHGADTCTPDLLREVRRAADELGCVVTTHLAQTPEELIFLRERYGKEPVEYMSEVGLLGDDVLLAHCVHATDDEIRKLKETRTGVANCVISFAREGTNVPYARFADAGVPTAIGTDSHGMGFVSELRTAGFFSKLHFKKGYVASARQLVRAGTMVGADTIRRPDLGRLAPGAKADLLVVDLHRPHLQPVWDPIKNLIWKGSAADIVLIMIDGEPVVREGKLLTANEREIIAKASNAAKKIWDIATDQGILILSGQGTSKSIGERMMGSRH